MSYAIELGVSPKIAATIFGLMMGLNVVGGLGAGVLADRFNRKNVLASVYLLRVCAYVLLLMVPSTQGLWVFAAVVGFSWIATDSLTSTLTADVYGLRALGTITGVTFLFHQIGGLFGLGPLLIVIVLGLVIVTIPAALLLAYAVQRRRSGNGNDEWASWTAHYTGLTGIFSSSQESFLVCRVQRRHNAARLPPAMASGSHEEGRDAVSPVSAGEVMA